MNRYILGLASLLLAINSYHSHGSSTLSDDSERDHKILKCIPHTKIYQNRFLKRQEKRQISQINKSHCQIRNTMRDGSGMQCIFPMRAMKPLSKLYYALDKSMLSGEYRLEISDNVMILNDVYFQNPLSLGECLLLNPH